MSTSNEQENREKNISYTVEIRKAESGLLKKAMLFNTVKYAQSFGIDSTVLQDVLTYHYLKRISFTAIMDHLGKTVGTTLAWSTPMTCVTIHSLKEGLGAKRIMLTQSAANAPDMNHLTWAIFFHSPTLRKQLKDYGFEERNIEKCPLPLDFIEHDENGIVPYLTHGVVDRLFCAIERRSDSGISTSSALTELALDTVQVGEYNLYMFSMLKFYIDHYLLMVAPTGEFFDLATMDLLTDANRKKLFGIAREQAAAAEKSNGETPSMLETVYETTPEGEVDITQYVSSLSVRDEGEDSTTIPTSTPFKVEELKE